MNIVFRLLAPELEKEGSLLFKSTTANKKMFHIARDVLTRAEKAEPLLGW